MNMKEIGLVAAISLLMMGCNTEQVDAEVAPVLLSAIQIDEPVTNQIRVFKGVVVPAELTSVAFRVEGELQQVYVKPGQKVSKGQVVAKLDDMKLKQRLADAKAQFNLATKQYERGIELHTREMISESELDQLSANKKLMKANYGYALNQLKHSELVSPFSGKVSEVFPEQFERVTAGEPIVTVYQDDKVYVKVSLSDSVLARIDPQGEGALYQPLASFDGQPERHSMAYLEHTSEPDPDSKTFELWMEMVQPDTSILPGATVSMSVDMSKAGLSSTEGYEVPVTALQAGEEPGEFVVWKIKNDIVSPVQVFVNQVTSNGALLERGITQGDIIANSHLSQLRNGQRVNVKGQINP